MPTRVKKPSIFRQLAVTLALSGFLVYLGANAVGGQYGLVGQQDIRNDVAELEAHKATLGAEIEALEHRMSLIDPAALDPDLLTERAHALLAMAKPDDIVLLPPK